MINNYLERQIKENFPYQPTPEQEIAVKSLSEFLLSPRSEVVFMLRGYAGTGKTSLVGALVRTLDKLQQKSVLLAPTGRAAKVFSAYAGHPAFTIHKKIYRQQSFSNELSNFSVNDNLTTHTLYIVDEASMISNEGLSGSMFGTGRLLDDLVQFVYSGQGCRLLLMGDTAQLPPVGEEQSPALFADSLKGYGQEVVEAALTGGADFGVKAATAGALKVASEKEILSVIPKGTPAGTFANIAYVAVENVKVLGKVATGELTLREGFEKMQETTVSTVAGLASMSKGAAIGGAVGFAFGPVGAAVGRFFGGTVAYLAGSELGELAVKGAR